ncbi:MAG: DNA repair protein RadA [Myxococcota bacterium]|jgi:DNA repair protein RadA/Sms
MKQKKPSYVCQQCGSVSPRWLGKCPDCDSWNSYVEEQTRPTASKRPNAPPRGTSRSPVLIRDIPTETDARDRTGLSEFDRVLGGGLVRGSVTLLGGAPGIGKSTILMQILDLMSRKGLRCLYVTAEESLAQTRLRAQRLGLSPEGVLMLAETSVEDILETMNQTTPSVTVIDSIQSVYSSSVLSTPGSVSQVREAAGAFVEWAKRNGSSVFLVGHVTKDGAIAGPRLLEHMVDTVLYFEEMPGGGHRLVRTYKNRFGATSEVGVFAMKSGGLAPVPNPSEVFLAGRPVREPGSVVVASMDGTRVIMCELQALAVPVTFGAPRRTAHGVDHNRVSLIAAVIERKTGLHLVAQDIFVNLVGGMSIEEPAVDLPLAMALCSSVRNRAIPEDTAIAGEVGLTGEVRAITGADSRIMEAQRTGFSRFVLPKSNLKSLEGKSKIDVVGVSSLLEAMEALF